MSEGLNKAENGLTCEQEIEKLKADRQRLIEELERCYEDMNVQSALLSSLRKNLRRYEVQINSLKMENDNFKRKFGIIENNFFGSILLDIYRKYKNIILKYEK